MGIYAYAIKGTLTIGIATLTLRMTSYQLHEKNASVIIALRAGIN